MFSKIQAFQFIRTTPNYTFLRKCRPPLTIRPPPTIRQVRVALSKLQREKLKSELDNINPDLESSASCITTRSSVSAPNLSSTGVFPKICIFCSQKVKKHNNVKQKLVSATTSNIEDKIKTYARWMNDKQLIIRLQNTDFVSKEIVYHAVCRVNYQNKAEHTPTAIKEKKEQKIENVNSIEKPKTSWHLGREVHSKAFESICCYIYEVVLDKTEVHLTNDINQYQMLLSEIVGEVFKHADSTTQKLESKIQQCYENKLTIQKGKTKRGNIIFSSSMGIEEALRKEHSMKTNLSIKIRDVAFALRSSIIEAKTTPLPENITIEDIQKGEIEIPEVVIQFFTDLIGGPDPRRGKSAGKLRRIKSISEDAVFAVTAGQKKPAKHLKVGLAVKSLTGSRKIIDMLNRFGHSISYHTVEGLETELTFEASKEHLLTPNGMILEPNLGTGVAFDNFDRFVETLSGKNTLHDTVGIAYQLSDNHGTSNVDVSQGNTDVTIAVENSTKESSGKTTQIVSGRKRRRTFEATGLDIEPYRKKPMMLTSKMIPMTDNI